MNDVSPKSLKITVKAHPKAKKARLIRKGEGHYEIWVTAAADRGEANKAVLEALSDTLGIAKSRLTILSGKTSKTKTIEVL